MDVDVDDVVVEDVVELIDVEVELYVVVELVVVFSCGALKVG